MPVASVDGLTGGALRKQVVRLALPAVGEQVLTLMVGIAFSLSGGLRGAGDTRSVMTITGIGAWCVRVPLAVLSVTVLNLGLAGVQASMMLDWLARCLMLGWRFRPAAWRRRAAVLSGGLATAAADRAP